MSLKTQILLRLADSKPDFNSTAEQLSNGINSYVDSVFKNSSGTGKFGIQGTLVTNSGAAVTISIGTNSELGACLRKHVSGSITSSEYKRSINGLTDPKDFWYQFFRLIGRAFVRSSFTFYWSTSTSFYPASFSSTSINSWKLGNTSTSCSMSKILSLWGKNGTAAANELIASEAQEAKTVWDIASSYASKTLKTEYWWPYAGNALINGLSGIFTGWIYGNFEEG